MDEKPRILIVDDEPSARKTVEMLLLREGYHLQFAVDGADAFSRIGDCNPDVILLDVMMPGMDGFDVCRRLKSSDSTRHIPIILVTALDGKEDLARGLEAGADDFVHKPVNSIELRARVRSMYRIKQRHDELEATLKLRESVSNMIMHDLRSPLTTIRIFADLLMSKQEPDHDHGEELETISTEASRLSSYLTDMLLMAKMEQDKLVLNPSEVDLNEQVTRVYKSFEPVARLNGIDLEVNLPDERPSFSLDANLWERVLDNLVSNALKFSRSGGKVLIDVTYTLPASADTQAGQPKLQLRVLDEGPGIPEAYHQAIFDEYQIVATERRDIMQVGLGLAFCKLVVEAHGGRIRVENGTPRGAIFTIEL